MVVQECRSCIGGEDASGNHGFALSAVLFAGSALAYDAYDPNNCNGVDWDDKRALIVAKVTAQPRVDFIKSPNLALITRCSVAAAL
jgi:hypothetical protein